MLKQSINLLDEIDSLSKIHTLKRDDIDNLMVEFAKRILVTLRIERMSVWLFNNERDAIVSMGEYDLQTRQFNKGSKLVQNNYPKYFKAISENEILLIANVNTNQQTVELAKDYLVPNQIISLMDIPLRLEGKLVGIMCYEKKGNKERVFSKDEQVFALSTGLVFASNLEARYRRAFQQELKQELMDKNLLLKEIHHRVKNNLSVVSSLLNLQSGKAKDEFHKLLFDECKNKIHSIAETHRMVYKSKSFSEIKLREYFQQLLDDLQKLYSKNNEYIILNYKIEDFYLEVDEALPMSLIVNEVVSNAYKHAFDKGQTGEILFTLKLKNEKVELIISDNGKGFKEDEVKTDSLGVEIVSGLAEQLGGKYKFKSEVDKGTIFSLTFVRNRNNKT